MNGIGGRDGAYVGGPAELWQNHSGECDFSKTCLTCVDVTLNCSLVLLLKSKWMSILTQLA